MSRDRVESLHAPRSVMLALRDIFAGPWRAVLVLGVTQILAWGALFYPPVLTVPLIAADRGWSITFAMSGFSLALFTAGPRSPPPGSPPYTRRRPPVSPHSAGRLRPC